MKTKYLLIVLACLSVNACQTSSSNQTASNANTNQAQQAQVVTNRPLVEKKIIETQKKAANSNVAQAKYYPGNGAITALNKKTGEVELNHEEIQGKMPAGTTKFKVRTNEFHDFLKDLKVGDQVNFILEDDHGTEMISTINKIK